MSNQSLASNPEQDFLLRRYFCTQQLGNGRVIALRIASEVLTLEVSLGGELSVFDVAVESAPIPIEELDRYARLAISTALVKLARGRSRSVDRNGTLRPWKGDLTEEPYGGPTQGWASRVQPSPASETALTESDAPGDLQGTRRSARRTDAATARKIVRHFVSVLHWGETPAASLLQRAGFEQSVIADLLAQRSDRRRRERRESKSSTSIERRGTSINATSSDGYEQLQKESD